MPAWPISRFPHTRDPRHSPQNKHLSRGPSPNVMGDKKRAVPTKMDQPLICDKAFISSKPTIKNSYIHPTGVLSIHPNRPSGPLALWPSSPLHPIRPLALWPLICNWLWLGVIIYCGLLRGDCKQLKLGFWGFGGLWVLSQIDGWSSALGHCSTHHPPPTRSFVAEDSSSS